MAFVGCRLVCPSQNLLHQTSRKVSSIPLVPFLFLWEKTNRSLTRHWLGDDAEVGSHLNIKIFYLLFSHSIGESPLPSTTPVTKQKFSLQQSRCGGGFVLECEYDQEFYVLISVCSSHLNV